MAQKDRETMAIDPWTLPAQGTGRNTSRDLFNKALNRLRGNSLGTADPPDTAAGEWHLRSDTGEVKLRNSGDSAWLVAGKYEANLGMVRLDGSNAFSGPPDFGSQAPTNWKENAGAIGSALELLEVTVGSNTRVLQAYAVT